MVSLAELVQLADAQHRAGNWDEAERAYRQALVHAPQDASIRRALAWLLQARGDSQAALDEMRRAIAAEPTAAALHNELGLLLRQAGRFDESIASYQEAIRLDPALWQAEFNLGNAFQRQGQSELAAKRFLAALRQAPDDPEVHLNLGVAQKDLGQLDAARSSFQRALQIRPDYADAWVNLGTVCRAEGDLPATIDCLRRALEIDPQNAIAHNNLGQARVAGNDLDAAIDSFQQALRIDPNYRAAYANLGNAYESQGDPSQARACFQEGLLRTGDETLRIKHALTFPVILDSTEQIEAVRRQLASDLDELARDTPQVGDPVTNLGVPAFTLAYHGRDEHVFQSRIAALLRKATPSLAFTASHCAEKLTGPASRRIKVGFLSSHFYIHTIGKLNSGLIQQLDREQFEVVVLRTSDRADVMADFIAANADTCVTLAPKLAAARAQIAEQRLDVLIYTDVGMDAMTYYLAHARLAPVQCVTWGHPLTTGIETMDYFISSQDLEPAGSEAHYTEKLARLPHLANYYFRIASQTSTKTRPDFGLPDDAHVYACLQSLFKLHPDDDEAFAGILRRDPRGTLALLEGNFPTWTELLRQRFRRSIPDVCDRIVFLKHQPPPDFSRLLSAVDVLLDPLHFGGGDTSYQSFAVGAPIVTLPSGFLRGRITYTLYRTMGLDDLIAADADDYVERALRVANDRPWREQLQKKILAAGEAIFENPAGVRDFEAFLLQAVGR